MARLMNGHDTLSRVKDIKTVFGKKDKALKNSKNIWKKKSIFWKLPKNKDGINTRTDMVEMGIRDQLAPQEIGYDINGYTCYTKEQDEKSTVQNSGETLVATTTKNSRLSVAKESYYGVIEEIWELDCNTFFVPLFKCKSVYNIQGVNVDKVGFTCVNLSIDSYLSDPFILAKQATQIFYVEDPSETRWNIVMHIEQSIVRKENVVDKDDYNQFNKLSPFSVGIQSVDEVLDATIYLRSDHQEG
uniref:DUF4216 domain-containing protein n=1 Tax=Tanacetum cinerariifolium TaxID=118510 RepID=A0A699GSR2_TANCI|nr:hypothetical protein [Tanacetum cinerariifolium]